jgi:hypothetical protein
MIYPDKLLALLADESSLLLEDWRMAGTLA